jgi:hypothetical protein
MFVRAVFLAVFVALAGCASAPQKAAPEALASIKKVAVVSLAGHEFHRRYTGATMFGNEYEKQDISAWKIDDEYEAQIGAALAGVAPFEPVRIANERKGFYRLYEQRKPDWAVVEGEAKAFASRHSVDAILMVVGRESQDFLAGTNQHFQGAGFYARGMGSTTAVSVMHLVATVALIDGRTGKPVVVKDLTRNESWSAAKATPLQNVAPELARSKLAELGPERVAELRAALAALPRDAWEPTLRAMLAPK